MSAVDGTEMVGSSRLEPGDAVSCTVSDGIASTVGSVGAAATASTDPYTGDEYTALMAMVWNFDGDEEDLTRFDELLMAALAWIGRVALSTSEDRNPEYYAGRWFGARDGAARLLRSMEQRALWGPDHPVRQP